MNVVGLVSACALALAILCALALGWRLNQDIRRRQDKRGPKR
jgi:hypothetical protein